MLNQTSELAIRALIHLGATASEHPTAPREIARALDCSHSYMSKTLTLLVKGRILRSVRGAYGGVLLVRPPETISLREIAEACQGAFVGDYCRELSARRQVRRACAFHQAMDEVHRAAMGVLSRWTLADLLKRPGPLDEGNWNACRIRIEGTAARRR